MEQANPLQPKLTKNDQKVLKRLMGFAKVPDSEIAGSIGISPQAVFKIRNKLENKGIIKGYVPVVDFEKIGIKIMAILMIKVTPEVWNQYSDEQIAEKLKNTLNVISVYRISDADVSHILFLGFKDLEQKDQFISRLQTRFSRELDIKSVYSFSVNKIISHDPLNLFYEVIDSKESYLDTFLLEKTAQTH